MLKNILKFTIASVLAFGFNACNDSKEVQKTSFGFQIKTLSR